MIELTDTHCHIQSIAQSDLGETMTERLWAQLAGAQPETVLAAAHSAGVNRLVVVGCDVGDSQLAARFVLTQPSCYAAVGIHPHEAERYQVQTNWQPQLSQLVTQPKVVAVGECGLDYYYLHSPKAAQQQLLRAQIELALSADLPMIFHVREAFNDFWKIFDEYRGIRGVLHSFTDTQTNLDKALSYGLMIGVNGIATFTKEASQKELYRTMPINSMLLETDAPFLTPMPFRGQVNEPKHIRTVAEFLADLRTEQVETIARQTTENARKLFGV